MIPGAQFDHLHGAAREAAIAQADAFERDAMRRLAEMRAAFEGHPKLILDESSVINKPPSPAGPSRAARRRELHGAAGRAPGRRRA